MSEQSTETPRYTLTRRGNNDSSQPWEERFPRYVQNALVTAEYAENWVGANRRAAKLHVKAASNAARHGDAEGARLYGEMADAAYDAADALEDLAASARQVAEHYDSKRKEPDA